MSAVLTASTDVSMTTFEAWGWVVIAVIAVGLIVSGVMLDELGRVRAEADDERRRRERAEWARRTAADRAAARGEALARARSAGADRARGVAAAEAAARAQVIEQRRQLAGATHTYSTMPRRLVRDHQRGVSR